MGDPAAWLWAVAVVGGPILLALAFIYGIVMSRRRRREQAARKGGANLR